MSNLNLYNIEKEYLQLVDQIIDNEGELTPELEESLMINQEQLEQKGRGYGFVVKQLNTEIANIKSYKKELDAKIKSREKTVDRLKNVLKNAMNLHEITEIKTETLKINFRKSEVVEVPDIELLERSYQKRETKITADKAEIKKSIKMGMNIQGATLVEKQNIQIK